MTRTLLKDLNTYLAGDIALTKNGQKSRNKKRITKVF